MGKAVTFDTGGISIKPASGMEEMKLDMAGGAAVIEGVGLIAQLGVPVEVVAVVPATENMPSGTATRPGDVVRALNGKTIEVINTDAEGRLVLADALTYAATVAGATRLLDFATLTGAIVVALGEVYAGLFGSDEAWTEAVRAAGVASGDLCWPMPLHPGYAPLIKSKVADLSNAAAKRQAGAVYAAQSCAISRRTALVPRRHRGQRGWSSGGRDRLRRGPDAGHGRAAGPRAQALAPATSGRRRRPGWRVLVRAELLEHAGHRHQQLGVLLGTADGDRSAPGRRRARSDAR